MASARYLAASMASLLSLWSNAARAETTLHATGSVSAAYTDNANAEAGSSNRRNRRQVGTPYFLATPGLLLNQENKTTNYSLSYQKALSYFPEYRQQNGDSDVVAGEGRFELSERDVLAFQLAGTRSSVSSYLLDLGGSNADTLEALGNENRLRVDLSQSWSHLLNQRWSLLQGTGLGGFATLSSDDHVRWRVTEQLAFDYTLPRDNYRLSMSSGYLQGGESGEAQNQTHHFVVESRADWRHQLTNNWNSSLGAGANYSKVLGGLWGIAPAVEGSVGYEYRAFNGRLLYNHSRQLSLETGTLFESDQASLESGLLLSREHAISLTAGSSLARHAELSFDERRGVVGRVTVLSTDAQLDWSPSIVSITLSYSHLRQFDSTSPVRPEFARNVAMVTVSAFFPEKKRLAPSTLKRIESKPRVLE
ncbi:MAG: hypothetical protein RJA70_1728 [Pseudomonadota bacterium]|jgi:hypothetical protein